MRLDIYLVKEALVESRAKAQQCIKEGNVKINGITAKKVSQEVGEEDKVILSFSPSMQYVSRGGLKLEHALSYFHIQAEDKICLDIGASTGGFTDCLLQKGAKKIFAVDAGHAQLHESIRHCPEVVVFEQYNARYMKSSDFSEDISLVVMDVSFISQTLLLEGIANLLKEGGELVSLIKPQFELSRNDLTKKGVVKTTAKKNEACKNVINVAKTYGLTLVGMTQSPILGGEGNEEYLAYFRKR